MYMDKMDSVLLSGDPGVITQAPQLFVGYTVHDYFVHKLFFRVGFQASFHKHSRGDRDPIQNF